MAHMNTAEMSALPSCGEEIVNKKMNISWI